MFFYLHRGLLWIYGPVFQPLYIWTYANILIAGLIFFLLKSVSRFPFISLAIGLDPKLLGLLAWVRITYVWKDLWVCTLIWVQTYKKKSKVVIYLFLLFPTGRKSDAICYYEATFSASNKSLKWSWILLLYSCINRPVIYIAQVNVSGLVWLWMC